MFRSGRSIGLAGRESGKNSPERRGIAFEGTSFSSPRALRRRDGVGRGNSERGRKTANFSRVVAPRGGRFETRVETGARFRFRELFPSRNADFVSSSDRNARNGPKRANAPENSGDLGYKGRRAASFAVAGFGIFETADPTPLPRPFEIARFAPGSAKPPGMSRDDPRPTPFLPKNR
jgi:hypothetical protein